ncbi:hypothetical protein [Nocardia sp. CC201C]|uniref:hypothetical protein n=1 Tax=Nocardia sp. CC201C TaxID=3044575 RepID=UPI0024A9EB8F|nr:hypothetical protein [Nocardia sp. CC201C]
MKRLRELPFAPLWVLAPPVFAAMWGFAAISGFVWFGIPFAVLVTAIFAVGVARERQRYGGRERMRDFYRAVHARQLPILASPYDAIRWGQWIMEERVRRRAGLALSWFFLALAALCLILPALLTVKAPHGYTGSLGLPVAGVIGLVVFSWIRFANQRVLAALDALAQQGTARGYGNRLQVT